MAGQNAVENNELVQRTPESVMQNIEKRKEKIKSEVCTGGMSQAACNKAIAAEFDRNNAEFGKMLIDLATLVPGISEADALSILLNEKTLSGDEASRIWGAIGIITAGYGQKLRLAGKELLALNSAEELVTSTGHVIKNAEANVIKSESREVGKEAGKGTNQVSSEISDSLSKLTPEMEAKILEGQRITGTNKIIGGHSPNINNANSKYAVETIKVNSDGTRTVKYTTQFEDGNLAKLKTSTLFPENWSDKSIIDSVNKIGNTKPIGHRASTGETLHRGTVNGVEIDVIKKGNNITAGYPVGGKPTPGFNSIK